MGVFEETFFLWRWAARGGFKIECLDRGYLRQVWIIARLSVTCRDHKGVEYCAAQWRVGTTQVQIMANLSDTQEPQKQRRQQTH